MINPGWLRTFCTLVEVNHFTRTAEQLHMTQSGVSQHIRKLEEQLGVALLQREGKQFKLTDAGEKLYLQGKNILLSLLELSDSVREDLAFEGEVRLMSPGSVGLKLFPRLLALQKEHSGLVIDYRFAPNTDVENSVAQSRVDIGFMTRPSTISEVSCNQIAEEQLLLVTPVSIKTPSWLDLLQVGFIDHPDGAHHANLLLSSNFKEFQQVGQFQKRGFSNQINLLLEPVRLGLGFTVLPRHAVEAFYDLENINIHQLANPVFEPLYIATRSRNIIPNRVKTVIEEVKRWL